MIKSKDCIEKWVSDMSVSTPRQICFYREKIDWHVVSGRNCVLKFDVLEGLSDTFSIVVGQENKENKHLIQETDGAERYHQGSPYTLVGIDGFS